MLWRIGIERLTAELRKRPGDAPEFFDCFGEFVREELGRGSGSGRYLKWVERRIAERGLYCGGANALMRLEHDAELVRDIAANGIRRPIITQVDRRKLFEIDGWHRLVIARELGQTEILACREEKEAWVRQAGHPAPLTLLMAHPDDEIFLWAFLPYATRIIACVSDEENAERPGWGRRLEAFRAVTSALGVQSHCLGHNSGFYRMRREGLEIFGADVGRLVKGAVVATHNAWGEYGHLDHILCHRVALASAQMTLCTDIRLQRDWLPVGSAPRHGMDAAGTFRLGTYQRDIRLFEKVKSIYSDRIPWPGDIPVADSCEVYAC